MWWYVCSHIDLQFDCRSNGHDESVERAWSIDDPERMIHTSIIANNNINNNFRILMHIAHTSIAACVWPLANCTKYHLFLSNHNEMWIRMVLWRKLVSSLSFLCLALCKRFYTKVHGGFGSMSEWVIAITHIFKIDISIQMSYS